MVLFEIDIRAYPPALSQFYQIRSGKMSEVSGAGSLTLLATVSLIFEIEIWNVTSAASTEYIFLFERENPISVCLVILLSIQNESGTLNISFLRKATVARIFRGSVGASNQCWAQATTLEFIDGNSIKFFYHIIFFSIDGIEKVGAFILFLSFDYG